MFRSSVMCHRLTRVISTLDGFSLTMYHVETSHELRESRMMLRRVLILVAGCMMLNATVHAAEDSQALAASLLERAGVHGGLVVHLSLIHISEPTRLQV